MKVVPSKSAFRSRFQTTSSGCLPKAVVVSVEESQSISGEVWIKETNKYELLSTRRNMLNDIKTRCLNFTYDKSAGNLITVQVVSGVKVA